MGSFQGQSCQKKYLNYMFWNILDDSLYTFLADMSAKAFTPPPVLTDIRAKKRGREGSKKSSSFFRQNVKHIQHVLQNLFYLHNFSVLSPLVWVRERLFSFCVPLVGWKEGGGQSLCDMSPKKSSFFLRPSLADKAGVCR